MFGVTLVDHLRMTFGHVVRRYKTHARMARSRVRWSRGLRALEAALMIGVVVAAIQTAASGSARMAAVSAVLAVLALLTLVLHLTFDLDRAAQAHASSAARLWYVREQYRALLSDLADGALDLEAARRRRDVLMDDLHAAYQAAPMDSSAPSADRATEREEDAAVTDEEIDLFLPASLHKDQTPAA
jgi:hypothetical protein